MADAGVFVDAEPAVDDSRRKLLVAATAATGAPGIAFAAAPLVSSWAPSERARALGLPTVLRGESAALPPPAVSRADRHLHSSGVPPQGAFPAARSAAWRVLAGRVALPLPWLAVRHGWARVRRLPRIGESAGATLQSRRCVQAGHRGGPGVSSVPLNGALRAATCTGSRFATPRNVGRQPGKTSGACP
jgi:hypothetical protein